MPNEPDVLYDMGKISYKFQIGRENTFNRLEIHQTEWCANKGKDR
jgi:hypothetical protein